MSDAVAVIRRLSQHRRWVNQNLLEAAEAVTDDQCRQVFDIGQGSIWKSLTHLYAAEFVWLAALQGDENPLVQGDLPGRLPGNQLGESPIANLAELRQKWNALEVRWNEYVETLTPAKLDETIYKISTSSTLGRFGTRVMDVVLHVCTHAQYTSAQIVNMLRRCGVDKFPATMLIILARQESQSTPLA